MPAIVVKLDELLEQRGITRYRLAEYAKENTGLGRSTVFAIVQGRFQPRLETLAVMMGIVEKLSGKPVELSDVLEYDRDAPNPPPLKPFSVAGKRKQDKE
ncbi:MAG: helix-turn-helix transcriptional regulator [Deinococcus sp.]|nr:helix-turn-helix transcriptional regulator [Deinococcus sp.]